jgi:hypothetical protein
VLKQLGQPLSFLARWLGGWSKVALLFATIVVVVGGLIWQTRRQPNVPPEATQVVAQVSVDMRQTTFRYPGTPDELRAFYRHSLPARGWAFCGTQVEAGCSNMQTQIGPDVDVYRRAADTANSGSTIEVWPQADPAGQVFVTIYETRQQ